MSKYFFKRLSVTLVRFFRFSFLRASRCGATKEVAAALSTAKQKMRRVWKSFSRCPTVSLSHERLRPVVLLAFPVYYRTYATTIPPASAGSSSNGPNVVAPAATSSVNTPVTPAVQTATTDAATPVTAASFDSEVLQSQLAILLVFHIQNPACMTYLDACGRLVGERNAEANTTWLKLSTCNADRNPNLAAAFSVERAKLPITLFVFAGTIVDKVSGYMAEDRLSSILQKFKGYYEEQTNVVLGGPGSDAALAAAKQATLSGTATTEALQAQLWRALVGRDQIEFLPPMPTTTSTTTGICDDPRRAEVERVERLLGIAIAQSDREVAVLRTKLGADQRRLSEEELSKGLYSTPAFVSNAVLAGLRVLFVARANAAAGNANAAAVRAALDGFAANFPPAAANAPEVRRVVALAELNLLRVAFTHTNAGTSKADDMARESEPTTAVSNTDLHEAFGRWMSELDSPSSKASGEANRFPQSLFEEALAKLKATQLEARRSKDPNTAARLNATKTFLVRGIQLFPDGAEVRAIRSRLASLLY